MIKLSGRRAFQQRRKEMRYRSRSGSRREVRAMEILAPARIKDKSFDLWSAGILPAKHAQRAQEFSRFALRRARMPALHSRALRSQAPIANWQFAPQQVKSS